MGLLGISLIVASVVLFCLRPPEWLPQYLRSWRQRRLDQPPAVPREPPEANDDDQSSTTVANGCAGGRVKVWPRNADDRAAMPSPPLPIIRQPSVTIDDGAQDEEEQATPKAVAARIYDAVPSFTLTASELPSTTSQARHSPNSGAMDGLMLPPPLPQPRIPSLGPMATHRNLPLPNRGPSAQAPSTSTLAPPPTHSSRPTPPRRPVTLAPGHSPLDWARLSSNPTNNLSGLPSGQAYIRVAPSQLKAKNGRKGRDAWMVLGGRVYNVTPYLPFHPGGVPELMRGAGKDGSRLFGEVHPWVNYEGMLASCLVGVLVDEGEGWGQAREGESEMDGVD